MIISLQIWVSTPYFVLLTLNDSWMDLSKEFAINISYNDVVTGLQFNYRLVIYVNKLRTIYKLYSTLAIMHNGCVLI